MARKALPVSPTTFGRRGHVTVGNAGKPPKLRFQPGMFVRLRGQLYEIMYAYRLRDEPQEWRFSLEERMRLSSKPTDALGKMINAMGAGSTTPRIVYEPFRSWMDASLYFSDIPLHGNRWCVGNKLMVQEAEVISSGEVL